MFAFVLLRFVELLEYLTTFLADLRALGERRSKTKQYSN